MSGQCGIPFYIPRRAGSPSAGESLVVFQSFETFNQTSDEGHSGVSMFGSDRDEPHPSRTVRGM